MYMTQEKMIQFMYNKIVGLDDRFERIDERFERIDERFESIDKRFESIDRRFESIDERFQSIDDKLECMGADIKGLKDSMQRLECRVTSIGLALENEIRPNICIIAENHVELNRKLNGVLDYDCERETALIRLNMLETKVRELQEKESSIA